MSRSSKEFRRILITRTDRIGDVVLSTPVFQAVRKAHPEAYIGALVLQEMREIVEGNPYVDEVLAYDKNGKERSVWGNLLFAVKLRMGRWDAVINLHPTNRMHWVSFLAGIPVRAGYDRKQGFLLTHRFRERKREGEHHEAEYNFDLLRVLDIALPEKQELYFPLKPEARKALEDVCDSSGFRLANANYAVINPSASSLSKIWPAEYFAELADILSDRYGLQIALIGSGMDKALAERVRSTMKHFAANLAGKLSLGMLGHLLNEARLVVSNDSGPVHIAAACKTPVLSIFGRMEKGLSAKRWRPLGERSRFIQKDVGCYFCAANDCKIDFLCLRALSVEDVLAAIAGMEPYFLTGPLKMK